MSRSDDQAMRPTQDLDAVALVEQGKWQAAANAFRQALAKNPRDAGAWSHLAVAEWALGRLAEADEAYANSLAISRDNLAVLTNYARLLAERRQPERSLRLLEEVLNRDPAQADAWLAAAATLQAYGEIDQAMTAYRRALSLVPHHAEASHALAALVTSHGSLDEAEQLIDQLLAAEPNSAAAWALQASLRHKQARIDEAVAALRHSLAIAPNPTRHSSLLHILQYQNDVTPHDLLAEHRRWDAEYAAPLLPASPPPRRHGDPARPLRLGFVSADFGRHPTGFLALRPLECLDRSRCSIVGYYDRFPEDDYTARFRAASADWRVTAAWSNERLADQIRADQIDILFDLMGHTGARLLAFARKPAPIQITWLGYVGTTGLRAIDYLLADCFHVRPGEETNYAEKILRLPHGYACYGPPADAPEVAPLPAVSSGHVTFGCFNNAAKLSPAILEAWAQILHRVPDSQLLLKNRSLQQTQLRDRLHAHFASQRLPPQRILLESGASHRELLASYGRVDLALDTQPYSGGLTTCEALWMGVPVITFPGQTFAGRHSVSHLSTAGLEQFIAADIAAYVDLAVNWSHRLDELAAMRSQMRARLCDSPLCNANQFAADLFTLLQQTHHNAAIQPDPRPLNFEL